MMAPESVPGLLMQGDCLDWMRLIPDGCIDMVLCDLPYGTTQNSWDSLIPLDALWDQYRRIVKPTGAIVLTGQGPFTARLMLSAEDLFKYKLVWIKSKPTNFLNAKKQPLRKHEDVCVFYARQPTYHPQMTPGEPYNKGIRKSQPSGSYGDFKGVECKSDGERYPTDVVYFKTAESDGPVIHGTQKPVDLGRWLVRTFTNPGDLVLDNTFGSGSFLVAAVLEDRRWVGIEKNKDISLFRGSPIDLMESARGRLEAALHKVQI